MNEFITRPAKPERDTNQTEQSLGVVIHIQLRVLIIYVLDGYHINKHINSNTDNIVFPSCDLLRNSLLNILIAMTSIAFYKIYELILPGGTARSVA